MANMTKSTVSSSSGGGSIVSKSDTASKAGSDLVTGMADYQNCPMELIAAQGQVPGNQQHDAAVVEVVSDALGSWELLAESDKQGILKAAAALSESDQAASRNFKQGKQQGSAAIASEYVPRLKCPQMLLLYFIIWLPCCCQ